MKKLAILAFFFLACSVARAQVNNIQATFAVSVEQSGCGNPTILTTQLPPYPIGLPYYFQLVVGFPSIYDPACKVVWSVASGALPPGLTLSPSGLIGGIPTPAINPPTGLRAVVI